MGPNEIAREKCHITSTPSTSDVEEYLLGWFRVARIAAALQQRKQCAHLPCTKACQKFRTVPYRPVYTSSEVLTSKAGFSTLSELRSPRLGRAGNTNAQASTERIGVKEDLCEPQHVIKACLLVADTPCIRKSCQCTAHGGSLRIHHEGSFSWQASENAV